MKNIEQAVAERQADLRKMVFGSSSTFSRILMVPQNQREFFKIRASYLQLQQNGL